jgi:hypothetical protein
VSFTFRGTAIEAAADAFADWSSFVLRSRPSLSGLQIEAASTPGAQRQSFGGVAWSSTTLAFDALLVAASPTAALAAADAVTRLLDPTPGPGVLVLDLEPDWYWTVALSAGIDWSRGGWDGGTGFQLSAEIVLDSFEDAAARLVTPRSVPLIPDTDTAVDSIGTVISHPIVQIEGTLASAAESVTVEVDEYTCTVAGPLEAGQIMRLDWDTMDLGVWDGAAKVASLIRRVSTLDRPTISPATPATVHVSATGGTITAAEIYPTDRRG